MNKINLMQKFLSDRRKLEQILNKVEYVDNENQPYLFIQDIAILSSFMGYLKFQSRKEKNTSILMRGQNKNYSRMLPSIYRGEKHKIKNLMRAHVELRRCVKEDFTPSRFRNERLEDLFQHYGIKSTGIDVVDNIFIALWFALMENNCSNPQKKQYTFTRSEEDYGWIYFFKVNNYYKVRTENAQTPALFLADLRKDHSSLSLRLHCQHSYLIKSIQGGFDEIVENCAFEKSIEAIVKIPNMDEFLPQGELFSVNHFFPSPDLDNTYKLFLSDKFKRLLQSVEKKYSLDRGDLGEINDYK